MTRPFIDFTFKSWRWWACCIAGGIAAVFIPTISPIALGALCSITGFLWSMVALEN